MSNEPTQIKLEKETVYTGKRLRIALIGAGNIGMTHLDAYKKVPAAEIVCVCDIDGERAKRASDRYGIDKYFDSVETMLEEMKGQLDAADVCVWNCNHASCTIAALRAGLHVMCEKPMAYNAEESIEMKRVADEMGKLLMIGFVLRFSDEHRMACDLIESGAVGKIYYAKAAYLRRHGSPGGWFGDKARSGGGPVIDLGVHVIDQVRTLMGNPRPVSVYASTSYLLGNRPHLRNDVEWKPEDASDADKFDVEDFGTALIRFEDGGVLSFEASYSLNGETVTKKELYGDKGGLLLNGTPVLYTEQSGYLSTVNLSMDNLKYGQNMFVSELAHFVDCAQNGTPCRASAEDGIYVMKILDAVYESARTGHEVIIE